MALSTLAWILEYGSLALFVAVALWLTYAGLCDWYGARIRALPLPRLPISAQGVKTFAHSPYVRVSTLVVANRLTLIVIAALLFAFLEEKPFDIAGEFRAVWDRWDTRSLLIIAEHGYPRDGDMKTILVYYPLYPWLVRGVAALTGDYFLAGVAVSYICLLISCLYLYRLTLLEFRHSETAMGSVKYLLLYPLSFFASAAYTESLFLMCSIAAFFYMRRQCWWRAGLFAYAAALTRNQGILLFAPMAFEAVRLSLQYYRLHGRMNWPTVGAQGFALAAALAGFGTYLWVNWWVAGDPFQFLEHQSSNWGQRMMLFSDNIGEITRRLGGNDIRQAIGIWLTAVLAFTFASAMLWLMLTRLPRAYGIYTLCFIVISFSPSWLLSGARYLFVVFPLYMVQASLLARHPNTTRIVDMLLMALCITFLIAYLKHAVL